MPTPETSGNPQELHRCCSACWHSPQRPCPDVVACFKGGPSCHASAACDANRAQHLRRQRRELSTTPTIYIGMGTCGCGAGALRTLAAIETYLTKTGLKAEIVQVGCLGLCSCEPLVDIQLPGAPRVVYSQMTEEKIPTLLDHVFDGELPTEHCLGQHRNPLFAPREGVP